MNFDAHIDPIAPPVIPRLPHAVSGLTQRAIDFVVSSARDGVAANAQVPHTLVDALASANARFAPNVPLPGSERLAAAMVQALAPIPQAAQNSLMNANLETALMKLPTMPNPATTPLAGANPAVVERLAAFANAALQAVSAAEIAVAAAGLTLLIADVGAETLALTSMALTQQGSQLTPGGLPLGYVADGLPLPDDCMQRRAVDAPRRDARAAQPSEHDRLENLLPALDENGRAYTSAERKRLALLVLDPRRGPAPEALVALAAWRAYGLELARDATGQCDFIDGTGEAWNIISDADDARRERALELMPGNAVVCGSTALTLRRRNGA